MDLLGLEEAPKYCPICGAELSEADLRQGKCPTCGQKPPDTAAEERAAEKRDLRIAGTLSLASAIVAMLFFLVVTCYAIDDDGKTMRRMMGVIDDIQIRGKHFTEKEIAQRCRTQEGSVIGLVALIGGIVCSFTSVLTGIVGMARSDRKVIAAAGVGLAIVTAVVIFVMVFTGTHVVWHLDTD